VQLGVPQHLYDYQPAEGAYLDMLAQWVRWTRWRGGDERMARAQWAWAYRHACGHAHKLLKAAEDKEKPFKPSGRRVAVEVKSVMKIGATENYQVLWEETATEPNAPASKSQLWTGTYTVGRRTLTSMDDVMDNRLGICVAAYEASPNP